MEGLVDSLPSIILASVAMIVGAGVTMWLSNRAGVGEVSQAADRENDRLVAAQAGRIKLLETRVTELEKELLVERTRNEELVKRIDLLEKLVADDQIRRAELGR